MMRNLIRPVAGRALSHREVLTFEGSAASGILYWRTYWVK